jgi:hypothetical protein
MGGLKSVHILHRLDARTAVTLTQLYVCDSSSTLIHCYVQAFEDAHSELIRVKSKRCHRRKHPNELYPHVHTTDKP